MSDSNCPFTVIKHAIIEAEEQFKIAEGEILRLK